MSSSAPSTPPAARPEIGLELDKRYRLDSLLGEGGVGWVYQATHLELGHEVAIKMLQEQFTEHSTMRPRFLREARALAALKHPHIVTMTDFGFVSDVRDPGSRGRPYLVMELLEGLTLRELLEANAVGPERARRLMGHVLDALAFAHTRGFIHRDLKPDNIFVLELPNEDAFPKLLDFGFVKLVEPTGDSDAMAAVEGVLTRSGIAFGTPAYMSPEQATGGETDARSDLYSLGVVIYEVLSGVRPYDGSLPAIVRGHLTEPLPHFAARGVRRAESEELRAFLDRALAKEPSDRFQTAGEMAAAWRALPSPILQDRGGENLVSSSAPTVAAIPVSKRRDTHPARWRTVAAFVALLAVASLVPVLMVGLGTWSDEVLPDVPSEARPPAASSAAESPDEAMLDEAILDEAMLDEAILDEEASDEVFSLEEEEVAAAEAETAEVEAADPIGAQEVMGNPPDDEATAADPAQDETGLDETRSPWRTRSGVTLLTNLHRRLARGESLSSGSERALKRYVRGHRDDPRPHLLLAMGYFTRGWGGAAVQRYGLAQRIDAQARHDPRMLRDLVRVAESEGDSASGAADFVARVYGALAAPEVEKRLGSDALSASGRERLGTLRQRL